eukprot:tig00001590_g9374.t1
MVCALALLALVASAAACGPASAAIGPPSYEARRGDAREWMICTGPCSFSVYVEPRFGAIEVFLRVDGRPAYAYKTEAAAAAPRSLDYGAEEVAVDGWPTAGVGYPRIFFRSGRAERGCKLAVANERGFNYTARYAVVISARPDGEPAPAARVLAASAVFTWGGLVYILGTHLGPAGSRPAVSLAGVPCTGAEVLLEDVRAACWAPAGAPAPRSTSPCALRGAGPRPPPRRPRVRREPSAVAQLRRVGMPHRRIAATDLEELSDAERARALRELGYGALGTYCVAESMQRAWRALLASPLPNALVLEDDFVLPHDFAGRVARCWRDVPPDWHLVFVGGCSLPFGNPTGRCAVRGTQYCMHGHAVSRVGAAFLLRTLRGACSLDIDFCVALLFEQFEAQRARNASEGRPAAGPLQFFKLAEGAGHGSDVLAEGLYGNGFVFQDRASFATDRTDWLAQAGRPATPEMDRPLP